MLVCILLLGLFLFSTSTAFSRMYYSGEKRYSINYDDPRYTPKCNKKMTQCHIGDYSWYSSVGLYVNYNAKVVCNKRRTKCTDGVTIKRTSNPQY